MDRASKGPFEDYRRADVRFHIGVAEAAGSARLVTTMTEVQGQMSDLSPGSRIRTRCSPARTLSTSA